MPPDDEAEAGARIGTDSRDQRGSSGHKAPGAGGEQDTADPAAYGSVSSKGSKTGGRSGKVTRFVQPDISETASDAISLHEPDDDEGLGGFRGMYRRNVFLSAIALLVAGVTWFFLWLPVVAVESITCGVLGTAACIAAVTQRRFAVRVYAALLGLGCAFLILVFLLSLLGVVLLPTATAEYCESSGEEVCRGRLAFSSILALVATTMVCAACLSSAYDYDQAVGQVMVSQEALGAQPASLRYPSRRQPRMLRHSAHESNGSASIATKGSDASRSNAPIARGSPVQPVPSQH